MEEKESKAICSECGCPIDIVNGEEWAYCPMCDNDQVEVARHKQITDLQSQLAQKDKQLEKLKSDNHALISDNAYQETDIFELNSRIEQLQKQLAESETKRKSLEEKVKFITEEKEENFVDGQKYNELKEQLVESEKSKESYRLQNEQHHLQLLQFYSRLGVEAFGADIHEKALETLMIMKEQLAEKYAEIESYKHTVYMNMLNQEMLELKVTTQDQDKISFAVDILEELAGCSNYINSKLDFECGSYVSEKAIRDKIKYLKGKKDE